MPNDVIPSVPIPPDHVHSVHVAKLEERLAGIIVKDLVKPEAPTPPPQDAPTPEPVAEATPAPTETTPAPTPKADMADPKQRMARSLAIQKRAEQAARNVQKSLRPKPAAKPAPKPQPDAAAQTEISRIQGELQAQVRLLQTDPMEFARQHGVTGARIAKFVEQGSNPLTLQMEQLRIDASNAIEQVRQEAHQKVSNLQSQLVAQNEATVQRNFFEFVEGAKDANPNAFAAIGTIYSDTELWTKANELAEKLEEQGELTSDWDEDKLLVELEAEARKDSRWNRIQARFEPKQASKPNAAATKVESNASQREETSEETPAPRPTPKRDSAGQFVSRSPYESHAMHLDKVMRRINGIG